ncbi:class I SAM-dependent methyltransferase [Burkholderiaceae bacterium]|nr:class I SAM-dependent methyltransferase [Burkholderiaceae bacterium]
MKQPSHNIKFISSETKQLDQDEVDFHLIEDAKQIKLRFHDYGELYKRKGLYEQLFYERLQCVSPQVVCSILSKVLSSNNLNINELRVLDLGAGNGMVGELLEVARVVGVDISEEAFKACERDRPNAYDAYYVADFCDLPSEISQELTESPRLLRRLQTLRRWSHEQEIKSFFTRGPRTCCSLGARA